VTAADWSAIAEWVLAAAVIAGLISWLWRQRQTVSTWFTHRWRKRVISVLEKEVTASAAWESVSQTPEVSMEAGVAYARTAAKSCQPRPATRLPARQDRRDGVGGGVGRPFGT
jgi:hypothetical protein